MQQRRCRHRLGNRLPTPAALGQSWVQSEYSLQSRGVIGADHRTCVNYIFADWLYAAISLIKEV